MWWNHVRNILKRCSPLAWRWHCKSITSADEVLQWSTKWSQTVYVKYQWSYQGKSRYTVMVSSFSTISDVLLIIDQLNTKTKFSDTQLVYFIYTTRQPSGCRSIRKFFFFFFFFAFFVHTRGSLVILVFLKIPPFFKIAAFTTYAGGNSYYNSPVYFGFVHRNLIRS